MLDLHSQENGTITIPLGVWGISPDLETTVIIPVGFSEEFQYQKFQAPHHTRKTVTWK